jgi:hypothetical protein
LTSLFEIVIGFELVRERESSIRLTAELSIEIEFVEDVPSTVITESIGSNVAVPQVAWPELTVSEEEVRLQRIFKDSEHNGRRRLAFQNICEYLHQLSEQIHFHHE